MLELTSHFVAFIDILGFSEMVRSDCESSQAPKYLDLLYEAHQHAGQILGQDIESGLIQFSDSIVFSRPLDFSQLAAFIEAIANWQKSLLLSGLLCRGGLTFGKHFVKDRFMFSKGLIDAYYLESTEARFPRIIVSSDLLDLASSHVESETLLTVREEDAVTFIDYLDHADEDERRRLEDAIRDATSGSRSNPSVKEKLRWLLHYADFKLDTAFGEARFT